MNKRLAPIALSIAVLMALAVPVQAYTVDEVSGKQEITKPGTVYNDVRVKDDLFITSDVNDGTVTLRDVVIDGELVIQATTATVVLENVTCNEVSIENERGKVTVVATGSTNLDTTYLRGMCVVKERDLAANAGGYINLVYDPDVTYELQDVCLESMTKQEGTFSRPAPANITRSSSSKRKSSGSSSGGSSINSGAPGGSSSGDLTEK